MYRYLNLLQYCTLQLARHVIPDLAEDDPLHGGGLDSVLEGDDVRHHGVTHPSSIGPDIYTIQQYLIIEYCIIYTIPEHLHNTTTSTQYLNILIKVYYLYNTRNLRNLK